MPKICRDCGATLKDAKCTNSLCSGRAHSAAQTGFTPEDMTGLYRHNEMLVVDLQNAVFPNHCVVTNRPTDCPKFHYREKISSGKAHAMSQHAASAASGFSKGAMEAGGAMASSPLLILAPAVILASMTTVKLDIGLCEAEQKKYLRRKPIALRLIFGGLIAMFGIPVLYLAIFGEPRGLTLTSILLLVLGAGGAIATLGGLIYHAIAVRQPIAIKMYDGKYAWFSLAHKGFLSALPEFDPEANISDGA